MSYKVHLWDNLDAIEWSQAAWRVEGEEGISTCNQEFIHDVLLEHLPRDGLIVDAGCGTARWPIYLRRRGYRCLGVEISHDACLLARRADPGIPLVRGDTRRAPLRDGAADAIVSLGVVEHDEAGPVAGLRELHRILKPNGLLALAVPYNNPFRRLVMNHLLSLVTRRRRRAGMRLGFAEYRFDRREMRGFLRATGFEVFAEHPNDLVPPKIMGLWVDFDNLIFSPFRPSGPDRIFILPGLRGRIGRWVLRHRPWLVCGEALFVARRR